MTAASLINTRFPLNTPDNIIGNEEVGFGVKWTEDTWDFQNLDDAQASFARFVVDAPFKGEYPISLYARNFYLNYPFKVYTNTKDASQALSITISDPTYNWANEERQSETFNVSLNKGKNVIMVQVIRWGAMSSISFPKELKVVSSISVDNKDGVYTSKNFIYQANRNESNSDLLNTKVDLDYQGLIYDNNPSFEGAAILHFTPKSTTKSIDITYQVIEKSDNSASLTLRLGSDASNSYTVDCSIDQLNTNKVVHIPSYELEGMGFNTSSKQNLRVASGSGKIKLIKIQESNRVDQSPTYEVYNPDEIKQVALVRGRNISSSVAIGLDWTSSGIEFEIEGGGNIYMNMSEVPDYWNNTNTSAGGTRFAVEIDGVFKKYVRPSNNMLIASNLSSSEHTVAIYKTSEAAGGLVNLNSIKVEEGVTLSKPKKDYKFEILGDSITCGNQISATEENGYLSYATQLANSYNANLNVVSCSGRGLKLGYNCETGWNASWDQQVNTLWTETSYFRDGGTSKWSTANYQPDVVIANLGNNDLGTYIMGIAPMTITQFTDEVVSFSQKLRTAYPNAKIIWCYGAFVNRSYESQYRAAVQSLNDSNIESVYFNQRIILAGDPINQSRDKGY